MLLLYFFYGLKHQDIGLSTEERDALQKLANNSTLITLVNRKILRYQKTIISLYLWCAEPKSAVRFLLSRLQIEIFAFYSTSFLVNSGLL